MAPEPTRPRTGTSVQKARGRLRRPVAWTHGDFQQLNLLWDGGRVAAVLDWDRLRVDALAEEVTRAAVLMMDNHPKGLDLDRVAAFVDGYRTIMPLTSAQLVGAAHRWWWNYLCGLWPLNRHYEDGDTSCDRFFVINSVVLSWWYEHHDEVFEAFAGSRRCHSYGSRESADR